MKQNTLLLIKKARLSAQQAFVRLPFFIHGNKAFALSLLHEMKDITVVSNDKILPLNIRWSEAKQWLGQELGCTFFDLSDGWNAEKLCALIGCIKGGHLVFFWHADNFQGWNSLFEQRFIRIFFRSQHGIISCNEENFHCPSFKKNEISLDLPTSEQLQAIQGIEKVLYGHRRRPLFIIADRGRGKSSALGIAAAKILQQEKKKILVTSPTIANTQSLFKHANLNCEATEKAAGRLILANGSQLSFIAPDALVAQKPCCDLLLVDEAAAIPLPMLNQILSQYSRIVFSTTEHGYEGTGRGFSSKFRHILNIKTRTTNEISLHQPIRYAEHCPLERLIYDLFLFDAEPITPKEGSLQYRHITQPELLNDEALLKQLFALLVTAHYQTSPNDLMQLLDSDNTLLIGCFVDKILVAAVYGVQEGRFEKDLAVDIAAGKRRVKGHLLPQSLAQHTGIEEVLCAPILRIVRLAVLPHWQQKGIGTHLVKELALKAQQQSIAFIGASFSAEEDLVDFWLKSHFIPVRMGVHKDTASGNYSLQLLKPLSIPPHWLLEMQSLFIVNFRHQLTHLYQYLTPSLAAKLFGKQEAAFSMSPAAMRQVRNYAKGLLGFDLVAGSLYTWYSNWLVGINNATIQKPCDLPTAKMVFAKVIQQHTWEELATEYKCTGRKEIENNIRSWIEAELETN